MYNRIKEKIMSFNSLILKISLCTVIFLFLPKIVFAQSTVLPSPGITPDSPFYFIDTLGENLQLILTFGNEHKIKKLLEFSDEKLAEIKVMAAQNKILELKKSEKGYLTLLESISSQMKNENKTGKLAGVATQNIQKHEQHLLKASQNSSSQTKEVIDQLHNKAETVRKEIIKNTQGTFSNYEKFQGVLKLTRERIKENCPTQGFNSWNFGTMCAYEPKSKPSYSDEHHEIGGPCYWDESGKIEAFVPHSEILRYTDLSQSVECEVSCSSNNCPTHEEEESKRKQCQYPIYHRHNWSEEQLNKYGQAAKIDTEIAEECQTRGIKFITTNSELKEIKEKDCQIIENSCDNTAIKNNVSGKIDSARSCCCSCPRPNRENIKFTLKYKQPAEDIVKPTIAIKKPDSTTFKCTETPDTAEGVSMKYLTVTIAGHTYKFPEFTCADSTNYKVAWCGKVKSIPDNKASDQNYVINQFYEAPVSCGESCQSQGMTQFSAACAPIKSNLGIEYGACTCTNTAP